MLFLTAISIGVCAGLTRSAFSIAFIAVLIVATFGLATVTSAGSTSVMDLLLAALGYNIGIVNFLAGLFAIRRLRLA